MGPGYVVTDHETGTIHTKGRKAANKVARILNHAGFVDSGTGPCHDPKSGVLLRDNQGEKGATIRMRMAPGLTDEGRA